MTKPSLEAIEEPMLLHYLEPSLEH